MNRTRFLLFALASLLLTPLAQAQFEAKAKPSNILVINGGQAAATATAVPASYGLTTASFTISVGSQRYQPGFPPSATISGGGGSGATVTVLMTSASGGLERVSGITVTSPGGGYTSAPTITFSGGTPSGGGALPTGTGNANNFVLVSGGTVTAITVTAGGAGYTTAPAVTISPPVSGTTATATAVVSSGAVTSITITNAGSGYTTAPTVFIDPPPSASPTGDPTTTPQFAGVGELSAGAGPMDSTPNNSSDDGAIPALLADRFPSTSDNTLVLTQASIGGVFASGLPRYSFGEVITRPIVQANGTTPAADTYWRISPVAPGESFAGLGIVLPLGSVNVTSASTTSSSVIVASVPATLVVGATLLGQPVTKIVGTSVTLAGNANSTISSSTATPITPALTYYYSPHSEKVYASQAGRVTITWVTKFPNGSGNYEIMTETFAVSSSAQRPVRTIYWSEGIFDGPKVQIPDSRITTVAAAYNTIVPKAVSDEVAIPGYNPSTPNLTTLSFDRFNGIGQLHAYNVEGRILIEYLGNVRLAGNIYESLGTELVNLVRVPPVSNPTVHLGQEITPHDGDATLTPSPVLSTAQNATSYYGTNLRTNGTTAYYAERETGGPNNPDNAEPASTDAFNKVVFYWMEEADFSIKWPKFQDRYWLRWSPNLADYAHYTVDTSGSTAATGVPFTGSSLPQIVYQDDPAQAEAQIDLTTQRLFVTFDPLTPPTDKRYQRNRALLKFSSGSKVWYVNLYTQAEDRQTVLASTSTTASGTTTISVPSTGLLEVGMVVSGPGISGAATVTRIISATQLEISQNIADATNNLAYTVQADAAVPIDTIATVGSRLVQPVGHENAGYISSGTGYYPAGYLNPFVVGVAAANLGAIIPVNARPTDNVLNVRWFKKITAPSADFQDLYVPGKWGRYTVSYPVSTTPQIVIAQGVGTDDLPGPEAAGSIYYQNNSALPGYNPNEEHALMLGGRAYALREDLNVTTGSYTSEPFVLVAYTSSDKRPAIHAYKVQRILDQNSNGTKDPGDIFFDYTATAGTLLMKPYPLPLLPLAMVGTGVNRTAKDLEIIPIPDLPTNGTVTNETAYSRFTFKDRKGFTWVHRGVHGEVRNSTGNGTTTVTVANTAGLTAGMTVTGTGINGSASITSITNSTTYVLSQALTPVSVPLTYTAARTLTMKLYYLSQAGFWVPGVGEPAVGTVLPFLRNPARSGQDLGLTAIDNGQADEPLTVIYRPTWPTDAPELRVGETLSLPKFGLPQVRGQKSAQVFYEQSIAQAATNTLLTKNSVTLHDATREKTVALDAATVGLNQLPSAIKTSSYQGKIFFQKLPPHLQQRIYVDPLRGAKGTLVLLGTFHDEITGDDYLDLNLLTAADEAQIKGLVPVGTTDKGKWDAAIDALNTRVETFKPDPAQFGSYIVDATKNQDVGKSSLARITDANTAVDSYAVTATGQGTGFVTMVFGNGNAFTPEGDPVQVKVFKIANQLYVGDLKVITSSNPLDEQVTLRHSGDFAAKPEDYDFEWRWATGAASAPQTYATVMTKRIGDALTSTQNWFVVRDPGALKPTSTQYAAAGAAVPFTPARSENVHPVVYALDAQNQPTSTIIDTVVITPSAVNSTTITVADSSGLRTGMTVTGDSLSSIATVTSIPSSTSVVLSLAPSSATAPLTFRALTYSDADIAAGYPALMAKSNVGVDFTTSGVPGRIVFSADLGSRDGFVLYVNGRAALAYNAPSALFTLTNASSGLTDNGLSRQFSVEPSYFTPGPNTIEVAIYTTADPNAQSSLSFLLEAAQETDLVTSGTVWQTPSDPGGKNTNTALIGGDVQNPFGGPQFVLNDRWFTMRYKPKASANNVLGTPYSRWMPPQFVEGWVKRVLAAINPFEQRVKDLGNNAVSTDVSVITQAGTRWEGDVALTLDNINDVGLIAIYETVLNRAKSMSIDANTNDPDTNNALILAAGYLNDLYTLLGNEAYADAANPTISIDDQSSITEVNTSRFSFEGQVASSLDEELALLRGRDDSVSPGVINAPAYNRLYWNYTHGINSGEAVYAINYNIKEKVGSSTANGVIDESDAQRMFPQGHGDAYGHYLTALTGYYRLLTNANFTWTPRAEAVTVLGLPVTVDFQDERKFAAAAGNTARTAQQVLALTYRQSYKDDPASGWEHYEDQKPENSSTGVKSAQGLDEWASRSGQGALFHWAVANALVPDVDTYHTGVQKIDRTTVPEIQELAAAATTFQTTMDNANAHLNPLGLSPGAIAFDLSPAEMQAGTSHFEQVYARSLRSLLNASGAFNQAAGMTRSLRDQQNQLDDYNAAIVQQEAAYVNQLIDLYGRPYSGDVGAGKLYAQGYAGPDLTHWFIVDRPNDLVDTGGSFTITLNEATELRTFTGSATTDLVSSFAAPNMVAKTVNVQASQWVQYNDVWKTGGLGSRPETGELQSSLQDAQQSWLALREAKNRLQKKLAEMKGAIVVFNDSVATHQKTLAELGTKQSEILGLERVVRDLDIAAQVTGDIAQGVTDLASGVAEGLPKVLGIASDTTSAARGAILTGAFATWVGLKATALSTTAASRFEQTKIVAKEQTLEYNTQLLGFSHEEVQLAYELDNIYRELVTNANELMQLTLTHQRALQAVNNVLAKGSRILAEREVFRQRAAAIIQGYRTKDLGFRMFRNEALEQYRSLFDLASRYTYLAAKSYDYETGLLGTTQGQTVFAKIVASRALGDLTNGTPQSTTSTLGDAGLAGTMAQLNAEFSVAKGRLGINNPDQYGTVFSLRGELYRIRTDAAIVSDDDAWRQTLEQHIMANVMTDADVATYCRNIKKPNGSPVPGIVIPFSTTIQHAKNFFGLDYLPGDHNYTPSNFATKIYNVGIALPGYVGMDAYATGNMNAGAPASSDPNALGATPYAYLIPCGNDYMLAPPLGDTNTLRSWTVHDQALPLPYNLGANNFNSTQFFNANGTLSEQPWIIRKHQAFRMVSDPAFFYSSVPAEFTNSRLIGRSVWNGQWKIVIPAYTLHSNEQTGLDRFAASVRDIQLFLRTYSHSGN